MENKIEKTNCKKSELRDVTIPIIAGYGTFVVGLFFWIGGFISGWAFGIAIALAILGTMVLYHIQSMKEVIDQIKSQEVKHGKQN
jgi:amino acid permease